MARTSLMLLIPGFALVLRLASVPSADLSYFILSAYALLGRSQAIHALALSWLFSMFSAGVAPIPTLDSLGRFAVIGAAGFSVFLRNAGAHHATRISSPVLLTFLLGCFFLVHSLIFSSIVSVSALKAVSWTIVVTTLLSAWSGMSEALRLQTSRDVFFGLIVIAIVSVPLVFFPLGYLRNGSGFQGIFSQPQAFGPTMAILGAWAACRMLGEKSPPWSHVALVGLCVALVVLSAARTAGVAFALGVMTAVALIPLLTMQRVRSVLPGFMSPRVHFILSSSALALLLLWPAIYDQLNAFLSKYGQSANSLTEAYEASRGGLIRVMWANFLDQPFTGIGFGIASSPGEMIIIRDPVLELPISAAIEKGVLPIAVLEEVGIPGFLLVAAWILVMVRRAARTGVATLAVISTALLLNMGESTLFSPGGLGMILLILVTWASTGSQEQVVGLAHVSETPLDVRRFQEL